MTRHDLKYDPLKRYLQTQTASSLSMTFSEVEELIGTRLPKSSKLYRAWWSNDATAHVQAHAWLEAGYRTEQVDMDAGRLVFVREAIVARGVAEAGSEFKSGEKPMGQHPLIGSMKGTFTIEPGWDPTRPALDPEELAEWEANLDRTADELEKALAGKSQ